MSVANIEEKLSKYFFILNKIQPNLLLEIKYGCDKPSAFVVTGLLENNQTQILDHQLWFFDKSNATIRSKLNSYCLGLNSENQLVVQPYIRGLKTLEWVIFDDKIQTIDDFEHVITISNLEKGEQCYASLDLNSSEQFWILKFIPAKFYMIRNMNCDKVLDVRGEISDSGAQVIVYPSKDTLDDNQLWYEDQNCVLHSKMNDYIIHVVDSDVMMCPYNAQTLNKQQWTINGCYIQNLLNSDQILEARPIMFQTYYPVLVAKKTNEANDKQKWNFEVIDIDDSFRDHDGRGKYFILRLEYSNLVLEAQLTELKNKLVITAIKTSTLLLNDQGRFIDHQLFYFDYQYECIRTKQEHLCLSINETTKMIETNVLDFTSQNQKLIIKNGKIFKAGQMHEVITIGSISAPDDDYSVEEDPKIGMTPYMKQCFNSFNQIWQCVHVKAHFFFIATKLNSQKIMEVKAQANQVSGEVLLVDRKEGISKPNQLWYEDEMGFVRSKSNGFVLDTSNTLQTSKLVLNCHNQGWKIARNRLQNQFTGLVLEMTGQNKFLGRLSIIPTENKSLDSQRWLFLYI